MNDRTDRRTLGIAELAELGGVTRRTVRYYVQEGLLPAPRGVGRGDHYGEEHLERLVRIRSLQEKGLSLDEVRRELVLPDGRAGAPSPMNVTVMESIPREAFVRLTLAPGVELHVASGVRIPPPGRLAELAAQCRTLFAERLSPTGQSTSDDGKE